MWQVEVRTCICFHLPSLCLLVGAFTVKVIIHMYDPITIFLIGLSLFCVGLLLLCFLPREVSLSFVVKVIWWW